MYSGPSSVRTGLSRSGAGAGRGVRGGCLGLGGGDLGLVSRHRWNVLVGCGSGHEPTVRACRRASSIDPPAGSGHRLRAPAAALRAARRAPHRDRPGRGDRPARRGCAVAADRQGRGDAANRQRCRAGVVGQAHAHHPRPARRALQLARERLAARAPGSGEDDQPGPVAREAQIPSHVLSPVRAPHEQPVGLAPDAQPGEGRDEREGGDEAGEDHPAVSAPPYRRATDAVRNAAARAWAKRTGAAGSSSRGSRAIRRNTQATGETRGPQPEQHQRERHGDRAGCWKTMASRQRGAGDRLREPRLHGVDGGRRRHPATLGDKPQVSPQE